MVANSQSSRCAGILPRRLGVLLALHLILAPAVSLLRAQEPTVSMKIDLIAWGDDIAGLSLKSGESKGKITALAFRYSAPESYSGPAIMEIHKSGSVEAAKPPEPSADSEEHQLKPLPADEPKAGSESPLKPQQDLSIELEKRRKKAPTLVALAALPASGCARATILLAPADAGTFIAYVINDDPDKVPLGQLRIHNLSPFPIALRNDGTLSKELQTNESFLVPIQNQQLIYELSYKLGNEWKVQENNVMPVRETEQTQMIVFKSDHSRFRSSDGSPGSFLQIVTVHRKPDAR